MCTGVTVRGGYVQVLWAYTLQLLFMLSIVNGQSQRISAYGYIWLYVGQLYHVYQDIDLLSSDGDVTAHTFILNKTR